MRKENGVASILKVYGVLNGIACVFIGFYLNSNLPYGFEYLWIVEIAAGIVVSFLIYAFGEAIQLLQDIGDNTRTDTLQETFQLLRDIKNNSQALANNLQSVQTKNTEVEEEEIPEI